MQTRDFDDYEDRFEKLKAAHGALQENKEIVLSNMQKLADESSRVADVAHNSREIIEDLDREFESQTGLDNRDIGILMFATALQVLRICITNYITSPTDAGNNRFEKWLHDKQEDILRKFDDGKVFDPNDFVYYAPLNQIIGTLGVPYDSHVYGGMPNLGVTRGAQEHRFTTLGHDPVLGMIFGTANILTNTITVHANPKNKPIIIDHILSFLPEDNPIFQMVMNGKIPLIMTHHVLYYDSIDNPYIGPITRGTIYTLEQAIKRVKKEESAGIAALIKQIIHTGTDIFTKHGIQIPGANLILSNSRVEQLSKYITSADLVKAGPAALISSLINNMISLIHLHMYDETIHPNMDLYSIKTRKIVLISNCIASASNIIWVGATENYRDLDIGGILVTINRLTTDPAYIRQVKEEFVLGNFKRMIQGDTLKLEEVKPWVLGDGLQMQ